jgi:SnoaL-like domain
VTDPKDTVEKFYAAFYGGDVQTAKTYIADDLSLSAPSASYEGADGLIKASAHIARSVKSIETQKVFVDGSDVAVFSELELAHGRAKMFIAEWYRLRGDKIASIRTIAGRPSPRSSGPDDR